MEKSNTVKNDVKLLKRRNLPIIGLLVVGVAVSFFMFWLVHRWEHTNQRNEFESWAKAYANAVENTLHDYVGALLFLGDFFENSSAPVTRQQFTNLVESLRPRYSGIQAFGWDPLVKDDERAIYESAARQEGFENFEFKERSDTNELIRAARRQEYVVVYFIHPLEGNRPAFGFDIASNGTRLNAITKSFNTGKISATERIFLVQERGNQYGVLLLQPIYHQGDPLNTPEGRRKNRKGFVVEVLRIGNAVETALKDFSDQGISLTLYDMSADEDRRFLYSRPSGTSNSTVKPMPAEEKQKGLGWSRTFDFGERQWRVVFSPSEFFYQSHRIWQSWAVLFGLLLLTALGVLYMARNILYTAEIEKRVRWQAQTNQQLKNEITERTAAEVERDASIFQLQQALDEVKVLRGIIPICASCKKIRDDTGFWNQIESYIKDHSEAEFSHGICPDCIKELYPELYDN